MEKENWINSIIESASKIREAEPNPYLYSRIQSRLAAKESQPVFSPRFKLAWVTAIILVIAINISALAVYRSKQVKQKESYSMESLAGEFNTDTSYNY